MSGPYPYFQSLYNDSLPYSVCPCWLQHQQATGPLYHDLDHWHISGLCNYPIPEIWISNVCIFLIILTSYIIRDIQIGSS